MNTLDPEVIEFLQQSNLIESEHSSQALDDAVKAWQYLIKKPSLNKGRILHTHRLLMQSRTTIEDREKGAFRNGPVFIGGREAKKHYAISMLLENLLLDIERLIAGVQNMAMTSDDAEEAIKQHHIRFEDIHPFFDGNGRMGRIILNWERVQCGLPILVIREEDRHEYYKWFEHLK